MKTALAALGVRIGQGAALLLLLLAAACSTTEALQPPPVTNYAIDTSPTTRHAVIVVDASNGNPLFEDNSRAPRYPASLTKMMTLYMLFEAMQQGRVTMATPLPVSAHAASRPPTKMGLRPGDTVTVAEAIPALCTKSANDVAVAIAEYLGGSEDRFAAMMTARARQLGMTSTVFQNASGLPDDGQHTTARDMALLGMALRQRFPSQFAYFSARDFTFRGRVIRGHNDMLGRVQGVDGIKTGYIRASGYNIVTSVNTGGRKLVIVVMGGATARARNAEVEDLINRYLSSASSTGTTSALLAVN